MRDIKKIFLHVSKSNFGDKDLIRKWHVGENGWSDIGYHYIIGNAYPTAESWSKRRPDPEHDGHVYECRPLGVPGAHAHGHNEDSIAICLIGMADDKNLGHITGSQMRKARRLIKSLIARYPGAEVWGHYETGDPRKAFCPTIDMIYMRKYIFSKTPK